MGRGIYGGLYDPENKNGLIDENGFRTNVIECMKELQVPVVRYPGSNFVATYNWLGVGPREKRPKRLELAWSGIESNHFGTDKFMEWCEVVGAEPYLALNMGTGTLQEGANYFSCVTSHLVDMYILMQLRSPGLARILQFGQRYLLCTSSTSEWPRETL
jgi:alpha-N-arabinofuranosidase